MKKRLISLLLVLLMALELVPVTALAAAEAKPDKLTLVGSEEPLTITKTGTVDYYWYTAALPVYEVSVPAGTETVQLYGTVYLSSTYGSGYIDESTIEGMPSVDYWTEASVGSSSPYTVETRMKDETKNLLLVMTENTVSDSNAYLLRFVVQKAPSVSPTITQDLSTEAVSYTCGDEAAPLSVAASSTSGTLTYQWQVSTTSASEGFADLATATASSYTPSTGTVGSFWYRVVVTNEEEGKAPASVTSAAAPVTVTTPAGMGHLTIKTSIGYRASDPMAFTLTDANWESVALTADTTSGYAVYDLWLRPGTYTYRATATKDDAVYTLGTGTIEVTEGGEQTVERYLLYVYAQMSGWTGEDFTALVKDSDGAVMTPGQPYQFASYVAYPYLLAPGSYTYQILPSEARSAQGYQASTATPKALSASKTSSTWSSKLTQLIATTFTVPKGAAVTVTTAPVRPYVQGSSVAVTADTSDSAADRYTASLTVGSSYVYRASGSGMTTSSGVFKAATTKSSFDLTAPMAASPSAIDRTGQPGAADLRLSGVDHTGALALRPGDTAQLTPLRLWQIGNNSSPTQKTAFALEPDFHYSVVTLEGSDVVRVDATGKLTANSAGTALVLVTYDALYVGDCGWSVNQKKTFSAIWPENTGVVVVEVGETAEGGPAANMTIHSGSKKKAGTALDAEEDVLYCLDGQPCQYTFTPETGSTVTLLRPQLTESAMTFSGGFSTEGVQTAESGAVTLTLTEGRNIVRIGKDAAATYQVITVKKAAVELTNTTSPGQPISAGDTVKVQLKNVYHPQNWMAYLYNLYAVVSYTAPDGTALKGTQTSSRESFDTASGDVSRSFTVKIPESWDASQPFTLTGGCMLLWGNGKDLGSHRSGLDSLSSSVSYIGNSAAFQLGKLPDIAIPVQALADQSVSLTATDDSGAPLSDCTVTLRCTSSTKYDARTWTTADGSASGRLPFGTWSYTVSRTGYQSASGTVTVSADSAATVSCTLNKVTAIEITSPPTRVEYIKGSKLQTAGLAVSAKTASGSFTLAAKDYIVSPTTLDTVGSQVEITVSYAGLTATFHVKVVPNTPTIETTLKDGSSQKNSRLTFDVYARDYFGNKTSCTVKLNGESVSCNWDDNVKTSFTLIFSQEGANTITVSAGETTRTYTIHYTKVAPGESVGKATMAIEAFTLGGGYIIEPTEIDILEGENACHALLRLLEDNGFSYSNTGSPDSGFYLSQIKGSALASIDVTGGSIPEVLKAKLAENYFTISPREDENTLGEFDYTYGSGWMVVVNNVFPNVGFSDIYLSDGDVVRVQFTLAYGSDIGGGYAIGDSGYSSYYTIANKDALTALLAQMDASSAPEAVAVLEKLDATQEEVDAVLEALKRELQAADNVEALISAIGNVTLDSKAAIEAAEAAYAALTEDQKALVTNYSTLTAARAAYDALMADHAAADSVKALINAIGNVTLDSRSAIEAAEAAYAALTEDQKALVTNYSTLTAARAAYDALVADHAAADSVKALINAIGNVTLDSKSAIEAAEAAYAALTEGQKALVTNYGTLTAARAAYDALVADHAAADSVKALISAIGNVTLDSRSAIEAAEAAYAALTEDQKALVTNYGTLTAARAAYDALVADHAAADSAKALIAAIGEVTLDSRSAIEAAEAAYAALTEAQKALVDNHQTLVDARETYDALVEEANRPVIPPYYPSVPSTPSTPSTPSKPNTPSKPADPEKPETPEEPEQPAETARFTDVSEKDWFYDSVTYAVENGLMNGTGNDRFAPNANTTRGMIVTILARLEGVDTTTGSSWYAAGRDWAVELGISDGTDMTGEITREQLATMLYRYAQKKGYDTTARASLNGFADASSVSEWASEAMEWAVSMGLIQGSDGNLQPAATATRAQVATILMRFIENVTK